MKKLVYISIAFVVASCTTTSTEDYLTKLTTQRDSIKSEYRGLGAELAKVEAQIAMLDTAKKVINVTTAPAVRTSFSHYFKIYGSVKTDDNTLIYPSSQGEVTKVLVEEGQPVKKGQVLFTIDSEIIRKNIQEVKVQIELVEKIFKKQEKLWKQNIGSEMEYLQSKNNLDALHTKLATLKSQASKSTVTAPFSGTVDEILINTGQLVGPSVSTMRVVNLENVYLKADVPESYVNVISKGTIVNVNFPSIGKEMTTQIVETGKYINPANRTFVARVNLNNSKNQLYPNLLGMLEIKDYGNDSALVVPARLIQENSQGESFLYVIKTENKAMYSVLKHIEVGMTYNDVTEVISGLSDGDLIVDKGSRNVSNNQLVKVVK